MAMNYEFWMEFGEMVSILLNGTAFVVGCIVVGNCIFGDDDDD